MPAERLGVDRAVVADARHRDRPHHDPSARPGLSVRADPVHEASGAAGPVEQPEAGVVGHERGAGIVVGGEGAEVVEEPGCEHRPGPAQVVDRARGEFDSSHDGPFTSGRS